MRNKLKGQIPVLEMIAVTVLLFVTFSIFFPQTSAPSRWDDASIALKGRDITLTADRLGMLGTFVANPDSLSNFVNSVLPQPNPLIYWSTLDGTVQSSITIACNCTQDQISLLGSWIGRMNFNGRNVTMEIISSPLSPIQKSDVLLIWGYRNLQPYRTDLINYLGDGDGIVGIGDASSPDSTYTEVFGVSRCDQIFSNGQCNGNGDNIDTIVQPTFVNQTTYQGYKLLNHLPTRSLAQLVVPFVPVENSSSTPPCLSNTVFGGGFSFKGTNNTYWICNATTVYFDTNHNNLADKILHEGDGFSIDGQALKMNYIGLNRTFISFRPAFNFTDFRANSLDLYPSDQDQTRILLKDGNYNSGRPIPVVVMNSSTAGKAVWSADFTTSTMTDDKKLLLASMVMAVSSKKGEVPIIGALQVSGVLTPYINVVNRDMFEVYQFNLGLGFPFA